jgi:sterol desaturase/sphingolipid hydroxylase (fatty acid hydroxylase superfamily)
VVDDKTMLGVTLMNAAGEIGFLLASLPLFAVIGAAFFFAVHRQATWRDLYRFVFPFHRYRDRQMHVDLWMLIASRALWFPILNAIGAVFVSLDVQAVLIGHWGQRAPVIEQGWGLLALQLGVTYLGLELGGYWAHRFLHTQGFLWYTHRAHHSAEVLTFLVGGRGHPLEHIVFMLFSIVVGGGTMGAFLFLTGTSLHAGMPTAMLVLGLFASVMDKISHSELPISFGPLDYVFMSARMHQIHHSAEYRHRDKNFGGTMSLFDWIFGTAYRPGRDEQFRFGMSPDEIGANNPHRSLRALYLEPFTLAWADHRKRTPSADGSAEAVITKE